MRDKNTKNIGKIASCVWIWLLKKKTLWNCIPSDSENAKLLQTTQVGSMEIHKYLFFGNFVRFSPQADDCSFLEKSWGHMLINEMPPTAKNRGNFARCFYYQEVSRCSLLG